MTKDAVCPVVTNSSGDLAYIPYWSEWAHDKEVLERGKAVLKCTDQVESKMYSGKGPKGGLIITVVVAFAIYFSGLAQAENGGKEGRSDWDAVLGLGVVAAPVYEGSTHYLAMPIPMLAVSWRHTVSLGIEGFSIHHKTGGLRYGAGLTYDTGRKDDGKNVFGMSSGDHRLEGLGRIKPAVGLKAFAFYDLHPWETIPLLVLNGSVTKLFGSNNDGMLVQGGLSMPFQLGQSWRLTPKIGTTWANDRYMNEYFGVTTEQASRSQFASYHAKAGIKDVSMGLNATYSIDKNWFVSGDGRIKKLLGDADSSPISATDLNASFVTVVGYRF
jgi:MipA family protein